MKRLQLWKGVIVITMALIVVIGLGYLLDHFPNIVRIVATVFIFLIGGYIAIVIGNNILKYLEDWFGGPTIGTT